MNQLLPTLAVNLTVMAVTMAALHRALRWSVDAIHRQREQAQMARSAADGHLSLVETEERRLQSLPFVGQERRKQAESLQAEEVARNGTTGAGSNVKPFKRR